MPVLRPLYVLPVGLASITRWEKFGRSADLEPGKESRSRGPEDTRGRTRIEQLSPNSPELELSKLSPN